MKKIILILILVNGYFSSKANAVEDIYPCNIELKRPDSTQNSSGSYYARAYVEDRLALPNSPLRFSWKEVIAPKTGAWISLFTPSEEFRYVIQSLQFPDSTEKLGVSYRLGFCYLGPVSHAKNTNSHDSSQGSYDLVGTISTGSSSDYITYNGIVSGVCDLRSVGAQKLPRNVEETAPTSIDSDIQFSINLGQLTSGEMVFDYPINAQIDQVPRFCKLTAEITESSSGDRPSEVNINEAQFTMQIDQNLR